MRTFLVNTTQAGEYPATVQCLFWDPGAAITIMRRGLFSIRSLRLTLPALQSVVGVMRVVEVTGREDILALYTLAR